MNDPGLEEVIRHLTAALFGPDPASAVDAARRIATSTRERQLVAIATAHVDGDHDRVEALVRDHLVDYPAHPFIAWISVHDRIDNPQTRRPTQPGAPS